MMLGIKVLRESQGQKGSEPNVMMPYIVSARCCQEHNSASHGTEPGSVPVSYCVVRLTSIGDSF